MSESGFKKLGVIGIGTMGNGIAQVAAQSGFYIWEKYKAAGVNPDVARYRIK